MSFTEFAERLDIIAGDMTPIYWLGYRYAARACLIILTKPELQDDFLKLDSEDRRRIHLAQAQLTSLAHSTDKQWQSVLANATQAIQEGLQQFSSPLAAIVVEALTNCCCILNGGEFDREPVYSLYRKTKLLFSTEVAITLWDAEVHSIHSWAETASEPLWYHYSEQFASDLLEFLNKLNYTSDRLLVDLLNLAEFANNPKVGRDSKKIALYRNSFSRLGTYITGGIDLIIEGSITSVGSVRILLLGPGGSGKTTLYKLLRGISKLSSNGPTKGVNYNDHEPINFRNLGIEIETSDKQPPLGATLWDFAGQSTFFGIHRTFFTSRCVFVVVVDSRHEGIADSWLHQVRSIREKEVVGDSKVADILILTNIHEGCVRTQNETRLLRLFPDLLNYDSFHYVDLDAIPSKKFNINRLSRDERLIYTKGIEATTNELRKKMYSGRKQSGTELLDEILKDKKVHKINSSALAREESLGMLARIFPQSLTRGIEVLGEFAQDQLIECMDRLDRWPSAAERQRTKGARASVTSKFNELQSFGTFIAALYRSAKSQQLVVPTTVLDCRNEIYSKAENASWISRDMVMEMISNFFPAHLIEFAASSMTSLMFLIPQEASISNECYFLRPDTLSTSCYKLLNDISENSINGFISFEQFSELSKNTQFPGKQLLEFFESHKLCVIVSKGAVRMILFPELCQSFEPPEAADLGVPNLNVVSGSRARITLAFVPFGFFAKLVCAFTNTECNWHIRNPNSIWRNAFLLHDRTSDASCVVEVDSALNSVVATVIGNHTQVSTLFRTLIASLENCGLSLSRFPPVVCLEVSNGSELREAPVFRIAEVIQWLASLERNDKHSPSDASQIVLITQTVHGDLKMSSDEYSFSNISGQITNVGRENSSSNTGNRISNLASNDIEPQVLADELAKLRTSLRQIATDPDHDIKIGNVASAESAARKGDVEGALSYLKGAGKWALDVATKIGVKIAADAIQGSLES